MVKNRNQRTDYLKGIKNKKTDSTVDDLNSHDEPEYNSLSDSTDDESNFEFDKRESKPRKRESLGDNVKRFLRENWVSTIFGFVISAISVIFYQFINLDKSVEGIEIKIEMQKESIDEVKQGDKQIMQSSEEVKEKVLKNSFWIERLRNDVEKINTQKSKEEK